MDTLTFLVYEIATFSFHFLVEIYALLEADVMDNGVYGLPWGEYIGPSISQLRLG